MYDNYCINCNMNGHSYYNCKKPRLSNGIIAVKKAKQGENKFLMVKRKHTFGYIDFVRGKYSVNNKSHLLGMIDEMTLDEKKKIVDYKFINLWEDLWGNNLDLKNYKLNENGDGMKNKITNFENEKKFAENKLKTLRQGVYLENDNYDLNSLVKKSTTSWTETEWEFPKGRKNINETDIECAFREFVEETGLTFNDLILIRNLVPYEEIFIGSNYESYKNKYFVSLFCGINESELVKYDKCEISDVQWFTYSECLAYIRNYNYEKKRILTSLNKTLNTYKLVKY